MILSRRAVMAWFIIIVTISFCLTGSLAYHFLLKAPEMSAEQLKFTAERFLFFTILTCLLYLFLFFRIIYRSIQFSKSLEKLLSLSRSSGFSPDSGLRKLGLIGVYLADFLFEMNRLSEKKSLKISALNSLSDYLTSLLTHKVLVISATGLILYVSRSLLDDLKIPKTEVTGKKADYLFPDENIQHCLEEVFSSHMETALESGSGTVTPVLNHHKETAYAVCQFHKVSRVNPAAETIKKESHQKLTLSGRKLVRNIRTAFNSKGRRKTEKQDSK